MPKKAKNTSAKQRHKLFVSEYIKDFNATRAYQAVYKCSREAARKDVSKVMARDGVQDAIYEAVNRVCDANELTAERIMARYIALAFGDLRKVAKWGPDGLRIEPCEDLTPEEAALVASITHHHRKGTTPKGGEYESNLIKIKPVDQKGALHDLARIKGMFNDKLDASARIDVRTSTFMQEDPDEAG